MYIRLKLLLVLLALWAPAPWAAAQDDGEQVQDQAGAERRARIQELRQLLQEERQLQRQDIQRRLEGLSEDQRQALRERRRLQQQARQRRMQQFRGGVQCPCPQPTVEQGSETEP